MTRIPLTVYRRIPYTMKKFQNIWGHIYLQRYTRIPLKICFSLSFVSSTTCSSTAARAREGTPGTHCTQQRVDPPFCDSPLVYALTRLLMKKSQKYKNSQKQILHRFRPFLNHFLIMKKSQQNCQKTDFTPILPYWNSLTGPNPQPRLSICSPGAPDTMTLHPDPFRPFSCMYNFRFSQTILDKIQ